MKANEFVKKHGWTAAKKMIDGLKVEYHINGIKTSPTIVLDDGTTWISYDDLKRLVESWELVEKHGGLSGAKGEYFEIVHSGKYKEFSPQQICIAIKDVESCQ